MCIMSEQKAGWKSSMFCENSLSFEFTINVKHIAPVGLCS